MFRNLSAWTAAGLIVTITQQASAYNWSTHSKIAEVAVGVMQDVPDGGFKPPGELDSIVWQTYLQQVELAPSKLSLLRTGLPQSLPAEVTAVAPSAGAPPTEGYPFDGTPTNCQIFPDDNLSNIGNFRIQDFRYEPQRSAKPCGLKRSDPTAALPKTLGWHAAGVDDHLDDSILWFRPTNVFIWGVLKEAASRAFQIGAGALLLPFVCIGEALFGDGCDVGDSFDLATKYNPVDYVEGWIPGVGYLRSDTYTGLWHFLDVEATINRYNDDRGMFYEGAGPSYPGCMDVAIMAGSDLSGLSLNAFDSTGDDNYGKYDSVSRGDPAWQSHTIGHLEWSPIDNLARYGWDLFRDGGGKDARGLGWPLHAIGDVVEPHHVVGTTSWGHRPYEDFVDHHFDQIYTGDDAQRTRILYRSYFLWRELSVHKDIQRYITELAQSTRNAVRSAGDWPYVDGASFDYALNANGTKRSIESYAGNEARMTPLIEEGMAAALAFLLVAAQQVTDPGLSPSIKCSPSTHYEPGRGCLAGAPPPPPTLTPIGVCPTGQTCGIAVDAGAGGGSSSGCFPGETTCAQDGQCQTDQNCVAGCCRVVPR